MFHNDSHISDRELLMAADGELDDRRACEVQRHLSNCAVCRSRTDQITGVLTEFARVHRASPEMLPSLRERSRAELRVRMAEGGADTIRVHWWKYPVVAACVLSFILVLGLVIVRSRADAELLPNPKLTPGITRNLTKMALCDPVAPPISRFISPEKGQQIFDKYGIDDPRPGGYELDYLIDPELGGSDDPRNLWPQPYSATWNARVKDALEEHLHELVCSDQISLTTAQHDVADNWINAYRKYFHTDRPIVSHTAFAKDKPWIN